MRLLVCLCYKTWAFALCRELCRAWAHALPLAESFLHGGIQSPSYLEQVGHCCPQIHIPLPKTLCYLIEKLYLFYNINYPNQRYFPVCLALFGISPSLWLKKNCSLNLNSTSLYYLLNYLSLISFNSLQVRGVIMKSRIEHCSLIKPRRIW